MESCPGVPMQTSRIWAVSILFLLSGLSSLIYQVIWTRMLVFVFGSTTFATSTVLAVFMGGLAAGSYLASRYADKIKNPFLAYGILEGVIGFWAILAPLLFSLAVPLYQMFFDSLHLNVLAFGMLRFLVAALILGPPTACMGATLPLLSKFVTDSIDSVGDRVGRLYAINTLGAVLGSLAGGFILLPELGLNRTIIIAASINVLLALAVWFLSKRWIAVAQNDGDKTSASMSDQEMQALRQEPEPKSNEEKGLSRLVLAVMISFAVSGALAMIYEVAWTKALLLVIGSTTYAFTIMLSTFLIGIFLGSWLCSKVVDRLKNPLVWFAVAQIMLCFSGLISLFLFYFLPYVNLYVAHEVGKDLNLNMLFRFLGAAVVLVPITICLGAIFPLVVKICARDLNKIGSSIGKLYSVNTIGAIIGAFLAGFAIIPALGTELSLVACSVANFVLGIALLVIFSSLRSSLKVFCSLAAVLLVVWVILRPPSFWDYDLVVAAQPERRLFILGSDAPMPSFEEWRKRVHAKHETLFLKEGLCACVTIHKSKPEPSVITLRTSGHVDASDAVDMENQAIIAIYPLMLKPEANDVCIVGWGSGVTAGYALRFPIKSMICAEIEPVVLETSKYFHHVNFNPEADKRTKLEPADGRNFLLGTSQKFDSIISEPSNPWQAGVCNLFTREYFAICRDKLKENGIFTLWCQIQELEPKNIAEVFASLREEFPCIYLMRSGGGNVATLAFANPVKLSYKRIKESLEIPEVKNSIARFDLKTPEDYFARVLACPAGVEQAVQGAYLNTDDTNYLEYDIARTYETQLHFKENWRWLLKNAGPIWDFIDWGPVSKQEKAQIFARIAKSSLHLETGRAIMWANESIALNSNPDAFYVIAQAQLLQKQGEEARKTALEAAKRFPEDGRFPLVQGIVSLKSGGYQTASKLLSKALSLDPKNPLCRYYLAIANSDLDVSELDGLYFPPPKPDHAKVVELLSGLNQDADFCKEKAALVAVLADSYNKTGKYQEAIRVLDAALQKSPDQQILWKLLGQSYGAQRDWKRAAFAWNKANGLVSEHLPLVLSNVRSMIRTGQNAQALRQIQILLEIAPANQELNRLLVDYAASNKEAAALYSDWAGKIRSSQSPTAPH